MVYPRVPLQRPHLFHHRIPYLMSTDNTENPVPERSGISSEELRGKSLEIPPESENKNKTKDAKKYKAKYYMNCQTRFRILERILSVKVVLQRRRNPAPEDRDTANSSHELPMVSRAKVEEGSGKHSVCTHFPKDPNCDICLKTKVTRASCRWRAGTVVPRAEILVTWHCGSQSSLWRKWITQQSSIRRCGTRFGNSVVTILPAQNKNFFGDPEELNEVPGADEETRSHLHWQFPRIRQILWRIILEIMVRQHLTFQKQMGLLRERYTKMKEGTSDVLLHSGLDEEWWADYMECYCYLRNIQDLLSDGKTPYETRFGMPFNGPVIPFGAMVDNHPISAKDLLRLHQFGAKVLPGMYCMRCESGKETFWSQTLKNWRRWTNLNSRQKAQCKGSVDANERW